MKVIDLDSGKEARRKAFEKAPFVGPVSLIQLLATPERYHGKRVMVKGYAILKFEVQYIYPSKDMAISNANGLWLEKDFGNLPNDDKTEFLPVLVEGVFDSGGPEHLSMGSGTLCLITRFEKTLEP
jgi:hypothetical protein